MNLPDGIKIPYPRRRVVRFILRMLILAAFEMLCEMKIEGRENLPSSGPLLLVGNHFSYLDPVAMIALAPWTLEFIGGAQMPFAPQSLTWLTRLYGILPVRRGELSRESLLAAQGVLNQNGVLGIFPEAGSWASVLRPSRPGTALLASRTRARILPVGIDGLLDLFPMFRAGKRAKVTLKIGKPFGPFYISDRGTSDRRKLDEIGHEVMRHIAELIPPERRGHYSDDPAIREAARDAAIYPWENLSDI